MKDILIIVPSRSNGCNRETNVDRFIATWKEHTEGHSDLCISLDDDDEHRYLRHEGVIYTVDANVRFVPKVNRAALRFKDQYKYIANLSDDFVVRTRWEKDFIKYFEQNGGVGITYGNDLLQGERLPTAVCMTSNIIDVLGYMIPPQLEHMYADNFWKDIGEATQTIKYFPDIILEHTHPDAGKAVRDTQYVYAAAVASTDQIKYQQYLQSEQYLEDISKINNIKK